MDNQILQNALFQANLKVNRAYRHVQEADLAFRRYVQSDFCKLIEEHDAETGKQTFRVEAQPIPAHLVLAIGDTFHNLSAALDYVMTGMMRAAGVSATRISFPTDVTRQALRKSFMAPKPGKKTPSNRRIVETFPAFVMLLLQKIRPYEGGNFLLWEVRKADNIDKHNLIIPSLTVTELRGIGLFDEKYNNRFEDLNAIVGAGGRLNLVGYYNPGGSLKITNKGQPSARIAFAEGLEVFANQPVLPTLVQCVQLVAEALKTIEREGVRPAV